MNSFTTVIDNLAQFTASGGPLWMLVDAFCYFMALVLGMTMIMQLKEAGEGGGRMTYRAPVFTFIAASMFAAVPSSIKTVAVSVYGASATTLPPLSSLKEGDSTANFRALMQFVSFMGYIFFVSGISVLKKAGQPDRYPQETPGKATVVLLSAMCAIYIDVTLAVIAKITGWDVSNYIR